MTEENLETHELKERLEETNEHAEHARHSGGDKARWTLHLSLSTALIAVVAAIASLQSGAAETAALLAKNESILLQTKASDQWAFFQAKSMRMALYDVQADATLDPILAAKMRVKRDTYETERQAIEREAQHLEAESAEKSGVADEHLHHHHRFATSVTVFQISIALAAIAALTRQRPVWLASMVVGLGGLAFLLLGFGLFAG